MKMFECNIYVKNNLEIKKITTGSQAFVKLKKHQKNVKY